MTKERCLGIIKLHLVWSKDRAVAIHVTEGVEVSIFVADEDRSLGIDGGRAPAVGQARITDAQAP